MLLRLALVCSFFTTLAFAQLARPALNGLELRKGKEIKSALAGAEAQLASDRKEFEKQNDGSPEAMKKTAALREGIAKDDKRITEVTAQLAEWEKICLESHKADVSKYKADWDSGMIQLK